MAQDYEGKDVLLSQWRNEIREFQFIILHQSGTAQGHVDGLSRLPLPPSIVVISDMEAVTEELLKIARDVCGNPDSRQVITEG